MLRSPGLVLAAVILVSLGLVTGLVQLQQLNDLTILNVSLPVQVITRGS